MKKMIWTTYEGENIVKKTVFFVSAYYRPGDGVKALVITDDNAMREIPPWTLSLPTDTFNKIFSE